MKARAFPAAPHHTRFHLALLPTGLLGKKINLNFDDRVFCGRRFRLDANATFTEIEQLSALPSECSFGPKQTSEVCRKTRILSFDISLYGHGGIQARTFSNPGRDFSIRSPQYAK